MAAISLSKLNKHYGSLFHAVKDVDLEIADKEFVALVGPSGCGKSTTLRMIAGLEDISSGDIRIGNRVVNDLPPRDRDIAMVFQNYALYQHMSVYDNLAFGLRNKKTSEAEIKAAIDRAAGMLGLHELLARKPKQLSGGQQQRVALGRCIVRNPEVFLFDEPLSNLDAKLRAQMRIEIKRLHAAIPTTSVFVTHDQVEAMTLGDRVVIMRDGRVQQVGTPLQVYGKPANKFVAGFIGAPAMNFVSVTVRSDGGATTVEADGLKLTVGGADARALAAYNGKPVIMGARPEHLALGEGAPGASFDAHVEVVEQLGSEILLETRVGSHGITVARVPAETVIARGDQVRVSAQPGRLHFFDPETELPITTS
ncbi:sn-glycerol-3-phosphate ABC transporter ATP-binding protein UgpC [Bradyrhizobium sp. AUGA SZCCT0240]|uniref:ABC transporter ATP-binding protein n=1 Tax=unclassified Bradyrhizobium TaxID=2631580 RepID=UPI001BAC7CCA|nr:MULTISPECIES: sn-glycerol-3-phosphate ABC transporter ATP-binding protein UgpC [unclassified Bradyrhizobium]MBR1193631.1 sn-glycerol-3-phosphate ABC transporter ATP-binding protein UgpC [Bradyrhizobium sp. AUGA SZCCT0160]MBR1195076.1 sn-glycerol-3-phosphate ABC transporter ATP-binding protein UgpC [Bradyrhizobium sp. AUGA SZCCT0158]MBR1243754.1 sn-glycerol-3-phosphate ABC transporter ATP-binding protein UgpC [Bradyrhizobium sp. AUGA SZCCT0274]MBR1252987.1 sn-glycerol-3-phosphate ABC transpor